MFALIGIIWLWNFPSKYLSIESASADTGNKHIKMIVSVLVIMPVGKTRSEGVAHRVRIRIRRHGNKGCLQAGDTAAGDGKDA
jgi:hypothetical protein